VAHTPAHPSQKPRARNDRCRKFLQFFSLLGRGGMYALLSSPCTTARRFYSSVAVRLSLRRRGKKSSAKLIRHVANFFHNGTGPPPPPPNCVCTIYIFRVVLDLLDKNSLKRNHSIANTVGRPHAIKFIYILYYQPPTFLIS